MLHVELAREGAEVAQGGDLGRDVGVRRPDHQCEESQTLGFGQATGDAEVEERRLARRQDEEVPPVQVPVEDAVEQRALQEADHAGPDDRFRIDAGGPHAFHVAEVEAVEPLHDEHAACDQRRVGPGNHEVALVERGERGGDIEHVLGFEPEVELLDDRLGEELDQGGRVGQRGDGDPPDEVGGQPCHDGEVLTHARRHRRTLHLDHDRRAVQQCGGVHLGDGGGGERGAFDRGEGGRERSAQLVGQNLLDHRPRFGRDLVSAPLELGHQLRREDAVTRGDDLPQLDVGGAQLLCRHPQPPRDAGNRLGAPPTAVAQIPQCQCRTDVAQRRSHAPQRRQGASLGELGERGVEARAHAGQPASPRQAVGLNVPGSGVAERAEGGVGRDRRHRVGRHSISRHTQSLWVGHPAQDRRN